MTKNKVRESGAHIFEDKADEEIEGNTKEVDDGCTHLLRHMLGTHFHHGRPEHAHRKLKGAECRQLELALERNACDSLKTWQC